ncbi:MAG: AraC family transcriptional regulator [Paenibacillus sp.]|nr:AraC family transcriptional regulator [Paenibacillus sp.]
MKLLEWLPELKTHIYWERKEQFLLKQDTHTSWVLFAVETGQFNFQIGNVHDQAEAGDLVICPPNTAFHRHIVTPLSFHAITFDLPHEAADQELAARFPDYLIHLPHTTRLNDNFEELRLTDPLTYITADNDSRKQHYFIDIWYLIAKAYRKNVDVLPTDTIDSLMEQVALHLRHHAHESMEIREIAVDLGLTSVQLTRRFKAMYAVNPLQYLTSIRIKTACTLLLETDWTLDVIAGKCSYENGYYLSRVFSKHMGCNPSTYRKQNQY